MTKLFLRLAVVLFLGMCCFVILTAMRGTTGILEGRVRDKQSGELLVGVNIVIVGTPQGAVTDSTGEYQINNIRAGVYDIRFSMIGYMSLVVKRVTILPDLRTKIDAELEVSAVEATPVEIRAERPLIQKDQATTAFYIGELKLEKLPISSFQDVLILQPGTTMEGNVRGGKSKDVVFLIDGLPVQDVIAGGFGANLPRSSITGLTMYTGGFEAEYGNALSGVVNVITKSGTNKHQLAVRVDRDSWIPGSANKAQDRLSEFEFSASGALSEDELYYFTANSLTLTDTRWWQDFDKFFDSPVQTEYTGFGKLDYFFSNSLKLSLQGIYSLRKWRDYEFSWRFNLDGLPRRLRQSSRFAATLTHTLSNSSFYTVSLSRYDQFTHLGIDSEDDLTREPYEYDFYLQYIMSGSRAWWGDSRQTIYTLKSDFTTNFSPGHLMKLGAELNQYSITSDLVKYEPQTTYFAKPIVGAPLLNYSNDYSYFPRTGSVYVQDKIELEEGGSSFSLGIRWDFLDPTAERPQVEFVPISGGDFRQVVKDRIPSSVKHQLSPRIAVAAPVGPSGFVFVNFGHYFQFPLFDYLYSGINPVTVRQGAKNVQTGNPDLQPERTIMWEIGYKQGITHPDFGSLVGSVTYFRKRMLNQIDAKTLIPFDSKSAGDYGFASYVNNAEASASGLEFVVSSGQDERLSGSVSYTYMLTEGISEYVDQKINYAQWGFPLVVQPYPLSWDQRHTIKADLDFVSPGDIQTSLVVLYNSPRPYTYYPTRDGFSPSLLASDSALPSLWWHRRIGCFSWMR
ncbi:MAG: TonB-dependent receptor [Bacteroidetes bacterium]|nr:TonB-dependent receptor [Bacteroidota bacterium]